MLKDASSLKLTVNEQHQLLAGLTAAKKILICRWKLRQSLESEPWLSSRNGPIRFFETDPITDYLKLYRSDS